VHAVSYYQFFVVVLKEAGKRTTPCNQKSTGTGQEPVPSANVSRIKAEERRLTTGQMARSSIICSYYFAPHFCLTI
jgi:cell division protein FtsN